MSPAQHRTHLVCIHSPSNTGHPARQSNGSSDSPIVYKCINGLELFPPSPNLMISDTDNTTLFNKQTNKQISKLQHRLRTPSKHSQSQLALCRESHPRRCTIPPRCRRPRRTLTAATPPNECKAIESSATRVGVTSISEATLAVMRTAFGSQCNLHKQELRRRQDLPPSSPTACARATAGSNDTLYSQPVVIPTEHSGRGALPLVRKISLIPTATPCRGPLWSTGSESNRLAWSKITFSSRYTHALTWGSRYRTLSGRACA